MTSEQTLIKVRNYIDYSDIPRPFQDMCINDMTIGISFIIEKNLAAGYKMVNKVMEAARFPDKLKILVGEMVNSGDIDENYGYILSANIEIINVCT